MMIIQDYANELLLASNALMAGAAAIAILRFKAQCRRLEAFWTSPTGTTLAGREASEAQPPVPGSGAPSGTHARAQIASQLRIEQRMNELQKKVETIAKRPAKLVAAPSAVNRPLPIDNAVRMARSGASVDQLTKACGLNIGEARLMQKLHGKAAHAAIA